MELNTRERFFLEDSSDLDDSDVETLLENHRQQMLVMALIMKENDNEN